MILTQAQLAQTIRETLFVPLTYLVREDEIPHIEDPIEREEARQSIKQCGEAIIQEVRRLLKEMDLQIEPPDINNPEEVREFIEYLSRSDFRVNYST